MLKSPPLVPLLPRRGDEKFKKGEKKCTGYT
jgi:hypothetical protein